MVSRLRSARALALALLLVVVLSVSGCNILIGGQATGSSSTSTATPTLPKLDRQVVRTSTAVAAAGAGFAAHVKCPAGKVSVGGGYYPDDDILVTASAPVADATNPTSSWEVYGSNHSLQTGSVYAYAVCVDTGAASGWQVVRTSTTVAAAPDQGTAGLGKTGFAAHVKCPAGTVSVGGGYYPDPGIDVTASAPVADVKNPTSSWEVYGYNRVETTQSIYAYAVCVSASSAPGREVVRTTSTVVSGLQGNFAAHVKCPAGTVSVGGGYYPDPGIEVMASYPIADVTNPTSSWEVYGYNFSTTTQSVYAYAVCVKS